MTRRLTVLSSLVARARAGSPFLLAMTSLLAAACSSSSSGSSNDAATDTHVTTHADAGGVDSAPSSPDAKAETGSSTGTEAGTDAHDGGDGSTTPEGGSTLDAHDAAEDAASEAGESGPPDAHGDGHVDAPVDGPVDAGFDAGPPAIRFIGRTLTDGTSAGGTGACTPTSPCYEWSGTQVVARFTGATAIDFTMTDDGSYFDVYVDGTLQTAGPIIGSASTTSYPVASGLDAAATHEVSLYKRTEASSNGPTQFLGYSFPGGGTLLPPAPPASRRIEVVGDSISCGYGVLGPDATCTEQPSYEDHDDSYGAITARSVGADLYTIASSGRGVYENIDGTMTGTLPDIYGYTVPYVGPGASPVDWNFASWTPDAVVIDLGTNDFFASATGDPGQPFVTAYLAFVRTIRQNYPNAYILCTNGPMLSGTEFSTAQSYIQSVVTTLSNAGDPRVAYLAFPTQSPSNGEGCDGHPSVTTQQLMATELTATLNSALGW